MNILFVCRGNIARSQMAMEIFKSLNNNHEVLSAGIMVADSINREVSQEHALVDAKFGNDVINLLMGKGIDASKNKRTQLNIDIVNWADIVVVMVEREIVPEYLSNSPKAIFWKIIEPEGTALEALKQILDQIDVLVRDLINKYRL